MKRQWFQSGDGTYFRNCPLIESEMKRTANPLRWRILHDEWRRTFRQGVTRTDKIGRRDVVVKPVPFREAYPNHPGLWRLDDHEWADRP